MMHISNKVRKILIKSKNVVLSPLHYYIIFISVNMKNMKSFWSCLSTTGLNQPKTHTATNVFFGQYHKPSRVTLLIKDHQLC